MGDIRARWTSLQRLAPESKARCRSIGSFHEVGVTFRVGVARHRRRRMPVLGLRSSLVGLCCIPRELGCLQPAPQGLPGVRGLPGLSPVLQVLPLRLHLSFKATLPAAEHELPDCSSRTSSSSPGIRQVRAPPPHLQPAAARNTRVLRRRRPATVNG